MEKFTKPELFNFLCDDLDGKYDGLFTSPEIDPEEGNGGGSI